MAVVELTKDNFEEVVTNNEFVIVDFWAPWCGPCRSFAPTYEKVSEDHPDVVNSKQQDTSSLITFFPKRKCKEQSHPPEHRSR